MDSSPTLTIRGPNSDDWASLYTLLNLPVIMLNSFEVPYVSEDAFRERFGNVSGSNTHTLIAETTLPSGRKRVIGVAWIDVMRNRRHHSAQLELVVHPDYQWTEAAQGLLRAVYDLAENWLGLRRLQLLLFAEDTAAVDFYLANGFEVEATLRSYAIRAGRKSDAVLLARLLVNTASEGIQPK